MVRNKPGESWGCPRVPLGQSIQAAGQIQGGEARYQGAQGQWHEQSWKRRGTQRECSGEYAEPSTLSFELSTQLGTSVGTLPTPRGPPRFSTGELGKQDPGPQG